MPLTTEVKYACQQRGSKKNEDSVYDQYSKEQIGTKLRTDLRSNFNKLLWYLVLM